ncbi:MAG: glycoside hydrolase family 10 protein [Coleofasciculus sp. G1-WW12-02]|uniref:glycoside hydrolase family 10 protein n=1 Tax=Coleofasciculus sp. G1-WW12-02 TaxID=3068483 RepID=UPI0032F6BF63
MTSDKRQSRFRVFLALGLILSIVLLVAKSILFSPSLARSQSPTTITEIRGVWLTNVASGVFFSPWGINRAIAQLSQLNFNTIYPVVWNRGHTFYPSAVAKQESLLTIMRLNGDVLAEIVQQGHRQGLRVIPWFEYGFMTPIYSELARRHPTWITQSLTQTEGAIAPTAEKPQLLWLNPLHPEVQQLILDLIKEVVSQYDVDGIQLDDHFGMPVELGYDPYTIERYQQEHYGNSPPNSPFNGEWMRWRANKISKFMGEIVQTVKSIKPDCIISLSPNPQAFAYKHYLQDWQTWVQRGWVDELVLQVYRDELSSFAAELNQPAVRMARRTIPVSVGILTGTLRDPIPFEQIQAQVEVIRDRAFDGVSFFYWETLWSYLTPESPQQRRREFRELFPYPAIIPN